ncbi:MAG: hypothetical protein GY803_18635 [Chloroflexi bacterium]|nr:hypothetical protein [Chloroflexota bacterium]
MQKKISSATGTNKRIPFMNRRVVHHTFSFLIGDALLSLFSIGQKMILGAEPFTPEGFIVPVLFGGIGCVCPKILQGQ